MATSYQQPFISAFFWWKKPGERMLAQGQPGGCKRITFFFNQEPNIPFSHPLGFTSSQSHVGAYPTQWPPALGTWGPSNHLHIPSRNPLASWVRGYPNMDPVDKVQKRGKRTGTSVCGFRLADTAVIHVSLWGPVAEKARKSPIAATWSVGVGAAAPVNDTGNLQK